MARSQKQSLLRPATIAAPAVEEVLYPQAYEVRGAGSHQVNGTYGFRGMCNGRPYYALADGASWLWYFESSMFPASMFCGWYISKEANSSAASAASDYYSAYVDSKLPPSSGWVTRERGFLPSAGCGANPPPNAVVQVTPSDDSKGLRRSVDSQAVEELVLSGNGCSEEFCRFISVDQAGCSRANGLYRFEGEMNHRPYFIKVGGSQALWYFDSCPLNKSSGGTVSYNGWYLSDKLDTSSYSAGSDMYSSYSAAVLPPLSPSSKWVTRHPGISPTSGCGADPVPVMQPVTGHNWSAIRLESGVPPCFRVRLLRIMAPSGRTVSIDSSEFGTVGDLLVRLEPLLGDVPLHNIALKLREVDLSARYSTELAALDIAKGDIIVSYVLPAPPHHALSKRVSIVGGGPVGLWTAIQIKSLCPQWFVECLERRFSYTRSHALRLDDSAFEGMVEWVPGRPGAAELHLLKEKWLPRSRTAVVEEDLRLLATSLGIQIHYGCSAVLSDFLEGPERPDIVICCDGSKSSFRHELLAFKADPSKEFREQQQLGCLLQIKFDAQGEIHSSTNLVGQFLQNYNLKDHFFNVLCGNFDSATCRTPVTIFALLNEEVASQFKSGSLNRPLNTSVEQLERAHRDLAVLLQRLCPEGLVESSLQITPLPVAYSIADQVAYSIGKQSFFLAGDAAMGLPLEKGLNYGWRITSRLASYICHCSDVEQVQRAYEGYFTRLSEEARIAVAAAYTKYTKDIGTASFLRSFIRPFV